MTKRILATALATAVTIGPLAASAGTRTTTAVTFTAYNHKTHKQGKITAQSRRQASYRAYYYHKYGYNPTGQQFRDWYARTYGVQSS
jgi:hypothetical protein